MKKNPFVDFLRALGVTLLFMVALVIPLAGPFIFLAMALPALLLSYTRGSLWGLLCAAAAGLMITGAGGWQAGMTVTLFILGGGVLTAWLIRRGWPIRRLIPVSTVATSLSIVATGIVLWLTSRFNLWSEAVKVTRDAIKMTRDAMPKNVDPETAKMVSNFFKEAMESAPSLLPGLTILLCLTGAALTVTAAIIILRKKHEVAALPAFSLWQIPWYWSWAMVTAIAATLAPQVLSAPAATEKLLKGSGLSLWLIFGPLYFVQGVAILTFLLKKWKAPVVLVAAMCAMVLLVPLAGQMTLMTGLLDTWFDLRKLDVETDKDEDETSEFPVSS